MYLQNNKLYRIKQTPSQNHGRANTSLMVKGSVIVYASNKDEAPTALSDMVIVKYLVDEMGIVISDLYTYIAIIGSTDAFIKGTEFELIGDINV